MRQLVFTADSALDIAGSTWQLNRADTPLADHYRHAALWQHFRQTTPPPAAQLRLPQASRGQVLCCADPISLLASMDQLHIGDVVRDLGSEDIESLNQAIANLLAADSFELEISTNGYGVLQLPELESFQRREPGACMGQNLRELTVDAPLPRRLKALESELQMLFFDHPINALREQQGKLPLSGLWFWGWGVSAPLAVGALPKLFARDATLLGWWRAQEPRQLWSGDIDSLLASDVDALVAIEDEASHSRVLAFLSGLSARQRRSVDIRLCDTSGFYRLRGQRRRLWPFGQRGQTS